MAHALAGRLLRTRPFTACHRQLDLVLVGRHGSGGQGAWTSHQVTGQAGASSVRHSRRDIVTQLVVTGTASFVSHASANGNGAAYLDEVPSTSAPAAGNGSSNGKQGTFQPSPLDPPTYVKASGRIVAIGDLHGDLDKAVDALRLARVMEVDERGEVSWSGGDDVVVQLGDVMDRGDVEIGIINLLRYLDQEARKEGGAVYMLNGNHEGLNVCGDFRYVTPGAYAESALHGGLSESDLRDWELVARMRLALYRPGGDLARELAKNPTVLIVNDTAFAHGGLLPAHVQYGLERLNSEVSAWMRGDKLPDGSRMAPPAIALGSASSVMWNRTLSRETFPTGYDRYHACKALEQALQKIGAKRLVVGHTPQLTGCNCECDQQVWRVDVGMSYGVLNRAVQVLELLPAGTNGEVEVKVISRASNGDTISSFEEIEATSRL